MKASHQNKEAFVRDTNRIQKLLNLTSSASDAEALSALRMAQKLLQDDVSTHLGDFLAEQSSGFKRTVSEDLYNELQGLYEEEVSKADALKKSLADKEKSLRKYQKDVASLKRELSRAEDELKKARQNILSLSDELYTAKRS